MVSCTLKGRGEAHHFFPHREFPKFMLNKLKMIKYSLYIVLFFFSFLQLWQMQSELLLGPGAWTKW